MSFDLKFYYFTQFDLSTKKPIYSLLNFNYEQYNIDFDLGYPSYDLFSIFSDFWYREGFTALKPIVVSPEYEKYFFPMTDEMIEYMNKYGLFHANFLARIINPSEEPYVFLAFFYQFLMEPLTEQQYRRTQDYFYEEPDMIYSKYNFDFEQFSNDFQVYGSKLFILTNFINRNVELSGVITFERNYGLYEGFKKYFIKEDRQSLMKYMGTFGVCSVSGFSYRNFFNIDFEKYSIENDLNLSPEQAKEQYIRYGQFEFRVVPFIQQVQNSVIDAKTSCAFVNTDCCSGSGFLYSNGKDGKTYLVSTYHLLNDNEDQFYIYASLQKKDINNYLTSISTTAMFRVIGIDRRSDIIVALFDETLPFNISNNIDITPYTTFEISSNINVQNDDSVFVIGCLGNNDIYNANEGKIMNSNYPGPLDEVNRPPSYLIQCYLTSGASGSPVIHKLPGSDKYGVIGLVTDRLVSSPQTCISIQSNYLNYTVQKMIKNFYEYKERFGNNQVLLNNAIKYGVPVSFMGAEMQYYLRLYPTNDSRVMNSMYPQLLNLNQTGGVLITDFKLGYDYILNKTITTSKDLNKHNIFKLEGPLLNTELYKRFLQNNTPILLNDVSYYNNIIDNYEKIYLGKFSERQPLTHFTYGLQPIAAFPNDPIYYNPFRYEYAPFTLGYYWYDGINWIYATETIGGNTPEWYVVYKDLNGNLYYQHKFEFPYTLYDYLKYINASVSDKGKNTVNLKVKIGGIIGKIVGGVSGAIDKIADAAKKIVSTLKKGFVILGDELKDFANNAGNFITDIANKYIADRSAFFNGIIAGDPETWKNFGMMCAIGIALGGPAAIITVPICVALGITPNQLIQTLGGPDLIGMAEGEVLTRMKNSGITSNLGSMKIILTDKEEMENINKDIDNKTYEKGYDAYMQEQALMVTIQNGNIR